MHKMRIRTVQSIMLFLIVVVYSNRLLSGAREDENIQSTIDEENRSTKLSPQLWQEGVKLVDVNTDQQVLFSQKDDSNVIDSSHEFSDYLASNLRDSPYPGVENYTRYTIAQSKIKPLIDDIINNVTWFQYPIRTPACRESTHPASVFVAIISAASYFDKRKSIRNTWLRDMLTMTEDKQMDLIGYAFILGQTDNEEDQERIRKESEEFGDILQIGMKDDYYNLTLKMVGLLNWLNTNCHQANFVLKVDDDVYVNVRNLIKVVKSLDPSVKGAYGSEMGGSPLRYGKYAISYENWPWLRYPSYLSGPNYLISGKAVRSLLTAAQTTPFMPFEDVYITGLCAQKAKISRHGINRWLVVGMENEPNPCKFYNLVTWETYSTMQMIRSHRATERFYRNETQCIIQNESGVSEMIADHNTTVTFQLAEF